MDSLSQFADEATRAFGNQSAAEDPLNAFVNEAVQGFGGGVNPPQESGDFVAGVKAGTNETAGLARAAAATVQEVFGFKDAAKDSMAQAELDMAQADVVNQKHLNSPFDIRTDEGLLPFASDAVDFMQFQVGKQVPNILTVAASALTGGVAGTLAVGGSAAAKQTLLTVGKTEISKKVAAQIAGGYAASTMLETGGIASELHQAGVDNPGVALAGGSIAGTLEFLPMYNLARMVGVGPAFRATFMTKLAESGLFVKMAGYGGIQALSEGGTEALQEVVASTARQVVDDHYDMLGPEGRKRILEAAIVGATTGLPFGAAGSVFVRKKKFNSVEDYAQDLADQYASYRDSTANTSGGVPSYDPYSQKTGEVEQESLDNFFAATFEGMGPPGSVVGNVTDTQPPAKTRLPTITIVGEGGLASADSQAINERNAFAEHTAEIYARSIPVEQRTPAQAALVKIKDRERATTSFKMPDDPQIVVGPIVESRADSGIILPGGLSDTRTDNVSLTIVEANRARPKPPKQPSLTVPVGTPVPRLLSADEVNRENVASGGTIIIKHGDMYQQSVVDQAIGAAVETAPQSRAIDTASLDLDNRFGNGIDRTKLTPIEQTQLQQLEEKDLVEGLSPKETDRLSFLLEKAQGVDFNLPDAGPDALASEVDNEFQARPIEDPTFEIISLLEGDTNNPYASRVAGDQTFTTTAADVQATLEQIALPNGPSIVVVPHAGVLPAGVIRAEGSKPGTRALFVPDSGTVYMIANRMHDAHSIASAYFHEVIGHYGLRKLLPAADYRKFVDLLYRSIPAVRLKAIAKLYDLSTANPYDRAEIAEEAFAIFSEANPHARLVDRVVAIVRDFIRRVFPNLKFNDYELRAIVTNIRRHLSAPLNTNNVGIQFPGLTYASRMVDADSTPKYTTRVLDALPKKDWLNIDHVAQALKATGAKASEMEVFREVLALPWMGRTFLASDLRAEVMKRIAQLEPVTAGVQQWNTYGLDRIGRVDQDTLNEFDMMLTVKEDLVEEYNDVETPQQLGAVLDNMHWATSPLTEYNASFEAARNLLLRARNELAANPTRQQMTQVQVTTGRFLDMWLRELKAYKEAAFTKVGTPFNIVWESPFKTEVTLLPDNERHFDSPYYMAHTRNFLDGDGVWHIVEIQSDMFQKLDEKHFRSMADMNLNATDHAELMKQARMSRTILNQVVRETIRLAQMRELKRIRFATADTAIRVQNKLNPETGKPYPSWEGIWRRYSKEFPKVYAEFGAKEVTDEYGHTWYELPVENTVLPVKVFASRVEQSAAAIGADDATVQSLGKLKSVFGAKAAGMFLTPLQIAKVYAIEPIIEYMGHVQKWWTTKTQQIEEFDRVAVDLASNKERADALSRAIFEVSSESDRVGRRLNAQTEVMPILQKHGVDKFDRGVELFWEVDASFRKLLDRMERGLKYNAVVQTLEDPNAATSFLAKWSNLSTADKAKLAADAAANPKDDRFQIIPRLNAIEKDIDKLRNRNYFPRKRFGQYTVAVRATKDMEAFGEGFKKGQLILFETHESRSAQVERINELKEINQIGQESFELGHMSDQEFQFLGMPPTLMSTIREDLKLTAAQQEKLKEIEIAFSPGRAFLRHLLRRKGIKGYSEDMIRVYASYGMTAANHIARMEHHLDMSASLKKIKDFKGPIEGNVGDNTAINTLFNYFSKHYDYILNPENDWAKLRALGFMWYLGFNVKSALVNSTQVPLILYPYLADRYGDGKAAREIAKALKDATTIFRSQGKGPQISNALNAMIDRGKKEGFIDESLATELAGFTESSVLQRLLPVSDSGKFMSNVSYYGSWMFRQAEKYTRTAAFIAGVRLAEQSGVTDPEAQFQLGKEAVQTTMFEYSKWNRPQFMRGKKSVVFLFWNWMQHASFLAAGGGGKGTAVRIWVMLLLAGGLQGLPFAENILDILDAAGTKLKELMGLSNPKVDMRRSLLEFAKEDLGQLLGVLRDQPDLVTHGLGRYYGLGPLSALAALGVPVPNVDISGSVSMGRFVPGVEELLSNERDPDSKFGKAVAAAMGPVAGIPYSLWKTLESSDPDVWKKWERTMPVAVRSLSKATRLGARGEETFRGGGTVAQYDIHDMETRIGLVSQAFGFSSTKLSQKYELMGIKNDMRKYYTSRRQLLMEDYAFASDSGNREALADARRAVIEFNTGLPEGAGALRLTTKILNDSIKQRRRRARLRTLGMPNERGLREEFRQLDQLIPQSTTPPMT